MLGDMIHTRCSHDPLLCESVARWRQRHTSLDMLLVRGNHDRRAGPLPAEWNITEVEEPCADGRLLLSHEPRYEESLPVLAGHIHPVFATPDFDGSIVRIPCFVLDGARCAILPRLRLVHRRTCGKTNPGRTLLPRNRRSRGKVRLKPFAQDTGQVRLQGLACWPGRRIAEAKAVTPGSRVVFRLRLAREYESTTVATAVARARDSRRTLTPAKRDSDALPGHAARNHRLGALLAPLVYF